MATSGMPNPFDPTDPGVTPLKGYTRDLRSEQNNRDGCIYSTLMSLAVSIPIIGFTYLFGPDLVATFKQAHPPNTTLSKPFSEASGTLLPAETEDPCVNYVGSPQTPAVEAPAPIDAAEIGTP